MAFNPCGMKPHPIKTLFQTTRHHIFSNNAVFQFQTKRLFIFDLSGIYIQTKRLFISKQRGISFPNNAAFHFPSQQQFISNINSITFSNNF
jgi:hypothetical protein